MAADQEAPAHRFRAVAPDGETRAAATDAAVRQDAGRMFQRHIRPITLQQWSPECGWTDYGQISTNDWWKTTGRRDNPVKEQAMDRAAENSGT